MKHIALEFLDFSLDCMNHLATIFDKKPSEFNLHVLSTWRGGGSHRKRHVSV